MKLFLTSKGLVNKEITNEFLSFVGSKRSVSIITTASEEYKENNRNAIELKTKLITLGFSVSFIDIEFESPELLRKAEIIIINGGNPYYLLYHLKKSKTDKLLKELIEQNTPIMGISSGLLVLMQDIKIIDVLTPEMNRVGLKDKTCMGLIEEIIVPHYDRFIREGKITKSDIDAYEKQSKRKVIRLGENQCLKYIDKKSEIIGALMK